MALNVSGFGSTRAHLEQALKPVEQQLDILTRLPAGSLELPEGKGELRKLAEQLDRAVASLEAQEQAGTLTDNGRELLALAKRERLRIDDGLLSWLMEDIQRPGADGIQRPPESKEIDVAAALVGDLYSQVEVPYVVDVLGPLAGKNTKKYLLERNDATQAKMASLRSKFGPQALLVHAARMGPGMAGWVGWQLLRGMGAPLPLSYVAGAGGIRAGFQLGKVAGPARMHKVNFAVGLNRFEGEVDHDLIRMVERAEKNPFRKLKGEALEGAVAREANLARFFGERRMPSWHSAEASAGEYAAQALVQYAGALESAASSGVKKTDLDAARASFLKAMKAINYAELPSITELFPVPPKSPEQISAAIEEIAKQLGMAHLDISNPPLARFIRLLTTGEGPLSPSQHQYLETLVGTEPSVGEVLAVTAIAEARQIDLSSIWSKDTELFIDEGLNSVSLGELIEGLGETEEHARRSWWGRAISRVAPWAGLGVGGTLLAAFGEPGLAPLVASIVANLSIDIFGRRYGNKMTADAESARLSEGVGLLAARGREYPLVMHDIFVDGPWTQEGAALADALRTQISWMDPMMASVSHDYEALMAEPEAQVPNTYLNRRLASFYQYEAPVYDSLKNYASTVQQLLEGEGKEPGELRAALAKARDELRGHAMLATAMDVLAGSADPELSATVAQYWDAKLKLAEALMDGERDSSKLRPLMRSLAEKINALEKGEAPKEDSIDRLVRETMKAKEGPDRLEPDFEVKRYNMVTNSRAFVSMEHLRLQRVEALTLTEKRAKQLPQETMNALWTQVLGVYGLTGDEEVPKVRRITVEREETDRSKLDYLPNARVRGELVGGGTFDVVYDASGVTPADPALIQIDLGRERLARIVGRVAQDRMDALGTPNVEIGEPRFVAVDDGTYTFELQMGDQPMRAAIDASGLVDADFLQPAA